MQQRTSFTYKLTPAQQKELIDILQYGNYQPLSIPYTITAASGDDVTVALYKSGKCLVQGRKAEDFVTFVLEPLVLKHAEIGYEDVLHPEGARPHMGVDESGKGDYFGPLVVAAAYVDEFLVKKMREMNVRDSKRITSDDVALDMGKKLRRMLGKKFAVVRIGPEAYNRLYAKMRNVNSILAWAHARAIENLLQVCPACPRAISDQFGNASQVKKALMKLGRQIELEQRHKAESDMAVAAASVIARDIFLRALKDLENEYGTKFPKGASSAVREAATRLAKAKGPAILLKVAKCHFSTTDEVLRTIGSDRSALGPEGQAVSKPVSDHFRRRRPAESMAAEAE